MGADETVRVWRLGPDTLEAAVGETAARFQDWRAGLSIPEQRRADGFDAEQHRREYIVAHVALRRVLGRLTSTEPALLRFNQEVGVKPSLVRAENRSTRWPDLRYSLSHTKGAVMIGAAIGREIGVDVERQRPMDDLEGMARAVMSEIEFSGWQRLPHKVRTEAFYRLWTRKESYLKAIGLGLFRDLHEVTVPLSAEALEEPAVVMDGGAAEVWSVRDLPVGEGFSASLCWQGADLVVAEMEDLTLRDLV